MKSNQKGFSAVVVLLALLLIVAIGFTGYYVWNSQQNKKTVSSEAKPTTKSSASDKATSATTPVVQDSRKEYTSKALALSMRIPVGWTVSESSEGNGMVLLKSSNYAEKTTGIGGEVPSSGASIKITTDPSNGKSVAENDLVMTLIGYGGGKSTKVKVGSADGLEYVWAYELPPVTTTSFIIGNRVISATYSSSDNSHTASEYTEYKNMLETIK